jgi:hypothetical protein
MKHLKSYNELNEELTRNQRMWLHLPYVLPGLLIKRFLGITTLLNYKWSEIKKKTEDSKFDPIFAMSSHEIRQMGRNINKITLKDLPENKLGFATFLRTWNLYLVEGDTHKDSSSKDPKKQRPIVYLSKDEIKTGDFFCGERVSDSDIYPDFKYSKKVGRIEPDDLSKFPIIVMIAKADKAEETIDISKYIDDICLDLEDDLPVEVKINFNKIGDELWVNIVSFEDVDLFYSDDLDRRVEDLRKNIESYLQSQNYKLKGKVYYYLKNRLWYFGDKGRFSEIRKVGKYDDWKDRDREYNIRKVSPNNGVNVEFISNRSTTFLSKEKSKEFGTDRYQFYIDSGDIKILLNDRDNCSDNYTRPNGKFNSKDGQNIQLQSILIKFGK